MNNFEAALMLKKIEYQKYGKGLVEDISTISSWYRKNGRYNSNVVREHLCNAYKCLTLAISLYIAKCSSPLPMYIYEMKCDMEETILDEQFMCTDESTYRWLMDTFQYAPDIPSSTPNSRCSQNSNRQVQCPYNTDYTIFNRLALLVGSNTIPFTVNYNSHLGSYHGHLVPDMEGTPQYIMGQLTLIQVLKARADSRVTYTLFEETIDEKLRYLLSFRVPVSFIDTTANLHESIRAMEILDSKYITAKDTHDNVGNTI